MCCDTDAGELEVHFKKILYKSKMISTSRKDTEQWRHAMKVNMLSKSKHSLK